MVTEFKQFEQIDNLVVTPITNVRPWIFGFYHFPVNALVGNTVGVVTIYGGGIEELSDDGIDEVRIREGECFPVLEYISPVTLIGNDRLSLRIFDLYIKHIPWTRWVSVSSTEGDR